MVKNCSFVRFEILMAVRMTMLFWVMTPYRFTSALKMETVCFSETLVSTCQSTRRQNSEEQHCKLYYSPNIIRLVKSRRFRWAGHVARMAEICCAYRFWTKIQKGRGYLEELFVVGTMVLKLILKKQCMRIWTGFICIGIRSNDWLL
jgi:hypothetical protein